MRVARSASGDRLAQEASRNAAEPPTVEVVAAAPSDPVQTIAFPGEAAAGTKRRSTRRSTAMSRSGASISATTSRLGRVWRRSKRRSWTRARRGKGKVERQRRAGRCQAGEGGLRRDQRGALAGIRPKAWFPTKSANSKKAGNAEAAANLNAARAQVQLEQAEVDRLTALTRFKTVKAPFTGTIVQRHIDTEDLVTAGSASNSRRSIA